MESGTWRAFDKDTLMTNGLEKGSWGNKPSHTPAVEGLSLGSPAGRGRVDKVSHRNSQQGGAIVGLGHVGGNTMAGEPRAGAVFLEDHQPRSGTL